MEEDDIIFVSLIAPIIVRSVLTWLSYWLNKRDK
ncbi:type I toxin-antitoxin system Fst family toxin [Staphylococcus succinus]|nr:type I toxin-antitoxin system Fst family toxin [Staphylococcus succinus]MBU0438882.1 type I toxin-antitoxin system Fst family toxin [Staphylococcus succinus]MEB7463090.1 type I toxin-antitoxin system Fst family toxin [Staphylococcus succinus]PTI48137.1 hypothetical protein BU060_04625 [Staphylococcus succinus]